MPGVVRVVTGKDFPYRFGLYMQDRFIFPTDRVRFVGEQVAAVIARDPKTAKRAAKLVKVVYKELEPVLDLDRGACATTRCWSIRTSATTRTVRGSSRRPGTNIAHWRKTRKGDIEKGFKEADVVFEDTYTVPRYAHCAIEPHVIVGLYDMSGRLTLWSASQSPYTQRHVFAQALAPLGLTHKDIRVVTPYVGGGFGGKAGVSMEIIGAALAIMVKGQPVKVRWSRAQEFYNTYQRQGVDCADQDGREEGRHDHRDRAHAALGRRRLRRVRRERRQRRRPFRDRALPDPERQDRLGLRLHEPAARRAVSRLRLLGVPFRAGIAHDTSWRRSSAWTRSSSAARTRSAKATRWPTARR